MHHRWITILGIFFFSLFFILFFYPLQFSYFTKCVFFKSDRSAEEEFLIILLRLVRPVVHSAHILWNAELSNSALFLSFFCRLEKRIKMLKLLLNKLKRKISIWRHNLWSISRNDCMLKNAVFIDTKWSIPMHAFSTSTVGTLLYLGFSLSLLYPYQQLQ